MDAKSPLAPPRAGGLLAVRSALAALLYCLALLRRWSLHFESTRKQAAARASWLNQVEGFFGILGKQSLSMTDFYSKAGLREHLAAYMRAWNRNPTPFAWTKPAHAIIRSHRQMLERISTAVH